MLRRLSITSFFTVTCVAQYAPIELPREWTFSVPTPAYSIEDADSQLGVFQPGIEVDVAGIAPDSGMWQVVFKRYGQPDIQSQIDPPNLALAKVETFKTIEEDIEAFPILKKLLELPEPWPSRAIELADRLTADSSQTSIASGTEDAPTKLLFNNPAEDAVAWGIEPLFASIDYQKADNPSITIEFWNKGDAFQSTVDPPRANRLLQERFEEIQSVFRTYREDPAASLSSGITAVRVKEQAYLLPNDIRVSIRYDFGEHLLLTFQSIQKLEAQRPEEYDPATFKERIAAKVSNSEEGHIFIDGIPMIDQGKKGYCAAATLARVLQFYGYPVDQHAMADLAETEAQLSRYDRGGTLREDTIEAMGRICGSTPFRLRQIRRERPEEIMRVIEQGIPIIWFIPGHARLLIGLHPDNNQIVYSDSWGLEHSYKTETWDYFVNVNQEMWILTPR